MARAVQEGPILSISDSADLVPGEEAGSPQGLTQKPAWGLRRQRQGSLELIWGREGYEPTASCTQGSRGPVPGFAEASLWGVPSSLSFPVTSDIRTLHLQ